MDRSTVVAQTETVTKRWAYELGHMPILYGPGHAWHGKDGIMAGGTSSTAITGASGRLICGLPIRGVITVIGKSQWQFPCSS